MASSNKKHHSTITTKNPKTYVYDLTGIGNRTPEYHPTTIVTKKPASKRYIWSLTRSVKPATKEAPVLSTGRKSVSHVETTSFEEMKAPRLVEGRKSVSDMEKERRGSSSSLKREVELMQVKVLVSDMPGFMQVHAFRCARTTYDSLEKFSTKHMAFNLKKEFDKVYGPAWHCIVGSSFGSFVTHSTGCFLYFSLEKLYVLLFKTKVRKALD